MFFYEISREKTREKRKLSVILVIGKKLFLNKTTSFPDFMRLCVRFVGANLKKVRVPIGEKVIISRRNQWRLGGRLKFIWKKREMFA